MHVEIIGPKWLTPNDAPRLRHLSRVRGHMRGLFEDPDPVLYVEARNAAGGPVGWAAAWWRPSARDVLVGVFVAPAERRHGIGRLLAVAINHAARRHWKGRRVHACPVSESGRRMYRSSGYRVRG